MVNDEKRQFIKHLWTGIKIAGIGLAVSPLLEKIIEEASGTDSSSSTNNTSYANPYCIDIIIKSPRKFDFFWVECSPKNPKYLGKIPFWGVPKPTREYRSENFFPHKGFTDGPNYTDYHITASNGKHRVGEGHITEEERQTMDPVVVWLKPVYEGSALAIPIGGGVGAAAVVGGGIVAHKRRQKKKKTEQS